MSQNQNVQNPYNPYSPYNPNSTVANPYTQIQQANQYNPPTQYPQFNNFQSNQPSPQYPASQPYHNEPASEKYPSLPPAQHSEAPRNQYPNLPQNPYTNTPIPNQYQGQPNSNYNPAAPKHSNIPFNFGPEQQANFALMKQMREIDSEFKSGFLRCFYIYLHFWIVLAALALVLNLATLHFARAVFMLWSCLQCAVQITAFQEKNKQRAKSAFVMICVSFFLNLSVFIDILATSAKYGNGRVQISFDAVYQGINLVLYVFVGMYGSYSVVKMIGKRQSLEKQLPENMKYLV